MLGCWADRARGSSRFALRLPGPCKRENLEENLRKIWTRTIRVPRRHLWLQAIWFACSSNPAASGGVHREPRSPLPAVAPAPSPAPTGAPEHRAAPVMFVPPHWPIDSHRGGAAARLCCRPAHPAVPLRDPGFPDRSACSSTLLADQNANATSRPAHRTGFEPRRNQTVRFRTRTKPRKRRDPLLTRCACQRFPSCALGCRPT
jgi:hypothetical protein